jgi:hypothetical protein
MKTRWFNRLLWLCGALLLTTVAETRAHTVWIEPLDGKLVVRFAEPGNSYEKSPGHLDGLSAPAAFTVITNAPVVVESPKSTNRFALVNAPSTNQAGVESIFTVRAARKPYFYARWQPAGLGAGTPMLTFDLVPTGKPGKVRVYFRGRPLGGLTHPLDGRGCLSFLRDAGSQRRHPRRPGGLSQP